MGAKSTATSRSVIFNGDTVTPVALALSAIEYSGGSFVQRKAGFIGDIT